MAQQLSMFDTQDLPLFSGTCPRATVHPFTPRPQRIQGTLFKCPICHDTGRITIRTQHPHTCHFHYCWCEAGRKALQHDREVHREVATED